MNEPKHNHLWGKSNLAWKGTNSVSQLSDILLVHKQIFSRSTCQQVWYWLLLSEEHGILWFLHYMGQSRLQLTNSTLVSMPLCASTGPVLAHNGVFTGSELSLHFILKEIHTMTWRCIPHRRASTGPMLAASAQYRQLTACSPPSTVTWHPNVQPALHQRFTPGEMYFQRGRMTGWVWGL